MSITVIVVISIVIVGTAVTVVIIMSMEFLRICPRIFFDFQDDGRSQFLHLRPQLPTSALRAAPPHDSAQFFPVAVR